jgi:hypothetical protein
MLGGISMRTTGFIVLALGLSGSAVLAQEEGSTPGAIPDPSTYQGSTELQRQSDEQSQQGYQQQFGQPQPSYGGGYQGGGGYGGAGRSSGPSRATLCFQHVARDPALARLAGLIELDSIRVGSVAPLRLARKPSAGEKLLLRRWNTERHRCGLIWNADPSKQTPAARYVRMRFGWMATEQLTDRLIAGQLTYGEFNIRRVANYQDSLEFDRTHGR